LQTLHPPSYSLWQLVRYMLRLGTLGFGGPVALTGYHWLNDRQFVDAVAVAMITPGPVVITAGFIGYLIAVCPARSSRRWRPSCPAMRRARCRRFRPRRLSPDALT